MGLRPLSTAKGTWGTPLPALLWVNRPPSGPVSLVAPPSRAVLPFIWPLLTLPCTETLGYSLGSHFSVRSHSRTVFSSPCDKNIAGWLPCLASPCNLSFSPFPFRNKRPGLVQSDLQATQFLTRQGPWECAHPLCCLLYSIHFPSFIIIPHASRWPSHESRSVMGPETEEECRTLEPRPDPPQLASWPADRQLLPSPPSAAGRRLTRSDLICVLSDRVSVSVNTTVQGRYQLIRH